MARQWTMYVGKWNATVTAEVVSGTTEYWRLLRGNVRYICTDRFGYDLYEDNDTGELYATQGNVWNIQGGNEND